MSVKYQSDRSRITVLRIKRSEKLIKILAPLILGLQWWNTAELWLVCRAITGYFRYFNIFELTREIRCHSDKNSQYLHQRHQWSLPPPPLSYFFSFLTIYQCFISVLSVFESFPTYFGWILACLRSLSALSFVCLFVCDAIQVAIFDQLTRNLVHIWNLVHHIGVYFL